MSETIGDDEAPLDVGGEAYLRLREGDRLHIQYDGREWLLTPTEAGLELTSTK